MKICNFNNPFSYFKFYNIIICWTTGDISCRSVVRHSLRKLIILLSGGKFSLTLIMTLFFIVLSSTKGFTEQLFLLISRCGLKMIAIRQTIQNNVHTTSLQKQIVNSTQILYHLFRETGSSFITVDWVPSSTQMLKTMDNSKQYTVTIIFIIISELQS